MAKFISLGKHVINADLITFVEKLGNETYHIQFSDGVTLQVRDKASIEILVRYLELEDATPKPSAYEGEVVI